MVSNGVAFSADVVTVDDGDGDDDGWPRIQSAVIVVVGLCMNEVRGSTVYTLSITSYRIASNPSHYSHTVYRLDYY